MQTALRSLTILALAAWFGAMLYFSAGVAPVTFKVLASRQLAGNVVSGALHRLHYLAYTAGALALVGYAARAATAPLERRAIALKAGIVALMLGVALYSGFAVVAPMAEMRYQVGAIDSLAPDNPTRLSFEAMHRLSVMLMGLNLIGVVAVLVLEQRRPAA